MPKTLCRISVAALLIQFFLLPSVCLDLRATAQEPAKLITEPEEYDFGEIMSGEKLRRDIKLINGGGKDLEIKEIRFSCGCTIPKVVLSTGEELVPSMEDKTSFVKLEPGQWARIDLEFQSIGRFGDVQHKMIIDTNDPKGQNRHIPIKAQIKKAFLLSPEVVDFGIVDKNKSTFVKTRVQANGIGPFKITGIENLPPCLTYEVVDAAGTEDLASTESVETENEGEAGDENLNPACLLKLRYLGTGRLGKHAFKLKVQVDHPVVKDFSLLAEMRIVPSIRFTCEGKRCFELIDLGRLSREEPRVVEINVSNMDLGTSFNVSKVFCKSRCNPPIETELHTITPGSEYMVRLTIPPQNKRIAHGRLIVFSDHPEMPQVAIQFKGFYIDAKGGSKKGGK